MEFEQQVKQIIADIKHLDLSKLVLDKQTNFIAELGFESLQILEFTQRISKAFDIDYGMDLEDVEALASWSGLLERLQVKMTA